MEHVLKTEGITKIYGKHTVVDHVSMHVKKGDIYGFIGKNGAGKTTFMRMVAGLAAPASGSMELFGSENLECQRQRIGVLIEQPGLYGAMNARENMEIVRRSFGIAEKNAIDEKKTYEMYYDFSESVKYIKHYRVLAINRGEKEKILTVSINMDEESIIEYLEKKLIKNPTSFVCDLVKSSIKDSLKRLVLQSIEREIRSEITDSAEKKAIETFGVNLEHLLLTRPIKGMVVLGFDPGYVNGCKLAVVDASGKYLDSTVIKPFLNSNQDQNIAASKLIVKNLIEKYKVDIKYIDNDKLSEE